MKEPFFRCLIVVLIGWLVLAPRSDARDIYVNNVAGSDDFDGSTPEARGGRNGPCRTIARALLFAKRSDRIQLANAGKPYRESITLQAARNSGFPDQPFEVVGNGAILEGAAPVARTDWEHVAGEVFRFSPPRKSYQLLFLDGKPAERLQMEPGVAQLPELKPLQWCLLERQIYFCTEKDRMPDSYDVSYSALPVGITLYEVRNVAIRDVIVQGFQLDGINAHDGVFAGLLSGVTCRGNARSGISIGGASRVRIDGCMIGNNGAAQVRTEGYSHTQIADSHLLDNTAPALVREGGVVHIEDDRQAQNGRILSPYHSISPNRTVSFVDRSLLRRTAY